MRLEDFNTLEEAKAYTTISSRLIHRDTMNSLLASAGLYVAFKQMALDSANPFQNLIAAFLDSTEYNFMVGNPTGDRQIQALDSMIASGGELGQALAALKPVILSIANPETQPFANSTQHDWAVANDDQSRFTPLIDNSNIENNYLRITVDTSQATIPFEAHSPSIYKLTHGKYVRIAGFQKISESGDYIAFVNNNRNLYVDNVYGAVV